MFSKTVVPAIFAAGFLQAAPRQALHNHVPQAVRESRRIGSVSPTARLDLAVGLPLRNAEEFDRFVEQVADPQSPNYRHYLTSDEFTERFGPSQEDYDKLTAFVQANGLTVSGAHSNRMILQFFRAGHRRLKRRCTSTCPSPGTPGTGDDLSHPIAIRG